MSRPMWQRLHLVIILFITAAVSHPISAQEAEKAENPLKKLIQGIFGGPVPAAPEESSEKSDPRRNKFDSRAPHDPRMAEMVRIAQTQIDRKDWSAAAEVLQRVFDEKEDSLLLDEKRWESVRGVARAMLSSAPKELMENYRAQFSALARQELDAALATGDLAAVTSVAQRYYHTEAGYQAANRVAASYFDHGEFGLALKHYQDLLSTEANFIRDPAWKLRVAYASRQINSEADGLFDGTATVEIAGRTVKPESWLNSLSPRENSAAVPQSEWPQLYGNASRTGLLTGGEPLLLPRWTRPITMSSPIQTQLQYLQEDLYDQSATPLPQLFPLMVDGKVIFRGLRGVQVVDAQSGAPLWETPDPVSVEMLVAAQNGNNYGYNPFGGRMMVGFGRAFSPRYYGGGAEYQGLTHVLFRNANYGVVSSDGERLFVVEDQPVLSNRQPGQFWGGDTSEFDHYGRSWSSNRLIAYRLESGRPAWEVGGPVYNDPFNPPLAGQFFLGAPTVDGEDLFVVAERDNEIRLFCLDSRTGGLNWSQLVAYSDAKIDMDVARQWFVAQPSVSDGVIIVPTTVGWIAAIDRRTHSVLWAQPYSASQPEQQQQAGRMRNEQMVQLANLNERWTAPAPVIQNGHVIFTPQEEDIVVCLDLYSGRQKWQKPREDLLFLAGVMEDRVVFGGRMDVTAFSLADGKPLWEIPFQEGAQNPSNLAVPSGRGVIVGDLYYQPLASGELWTIDLKTGKVKDKAFLPPNLAMNPGTLGNLTMYDGMLVSLSSDGLTAFEQREAFDIEIARRLEQDPRDPIANLRVAEMESLKRHHDEALKALHQIPADKLNRDSGKRYHQLLVENLISRITANILESEPDLAELSSIVQDASENRLAHRLKAQRLVASGEFQQALDSYLELARQPLDDAEMVSFSDDVQARPDVWLAGQLADLWQQIPEERLPEFDAWLTTRVETSLSENDADTQARLRNLFSFHSAVAELDLAHLERLVESKEFMAAENLLTQLRQRKGKSASALWRMAKLYEMFGLRTDLEWVYGEFAKFPEVTPLSDDKTVADVLAAWNENPPPPTLSPGMSSTWHDQPVQITRSGAPYNGSAMQEISVQGTGLPFFRKHRMQISMQDQRFVLTDVDTNIPVWSQPLRARPDASQGYIPARIVGHNVILLHYGVLHALSLVDRKVLWTHAIDDRAGANNSIQSQRMPLAEMREMNSGSTGLDELFLDAQMHSPLHAANERFVVFQGRRSYTVLDTDTGEVRWTMEGTQPNSLVHAGSNVIYVIGPDRSTATAFNPLDGSTFEITDLANQLRHSVLLVDGDIIRKGNAASGKAETLLLERYNPVSDEVVWSMEVPSSLFRQVGDRLVLVHRKQGMKVFDLATGKLDFEAPIPADDFRNVNDIFVFQDFDSLYLCLNGRRSNTFYSDGMHTVSVQGKLHAFDRKTGKSRWSISNEGQSLVLEQLDFNPTLVFSARKYERKGNSGYWSLGLEVVDKFSGRQLLKSISPSQAGFQNLTVNLAENYVELRSYNERVRLHPTPAAASTNQ